MAGPVRRRSRYLCAAVMAAWFLWPCARPASAERQMTAEVYRDRALGMWFGEIVGNYAGRPVEGQVEREGLIYAVDWDGVLATETWEADDDTAFEYLYADLLSQTAAPGAADIRQAWVDNIPASSVYIANRQARWLMDPPPAGRSLDPNIIARCLPLFESLDRPIDPERAAAFAKL